MPELVVFDDVFIDENVHSGLAVGAHHRQNLHELILGAEAVTLSNQLQDLVAQIESHNAELRAKERAIPATDRGPYPIDDFCALPARSDIDEAIREAERALATASEQDAIRTTPVFDAISLPVFELGEIDQVLAEDLPALDSAALAQ
ncbi:hypothetical protein IIA16_00745, partial [bacterium]|nr:hypothetical protein [bacterium]